MYISVCTKHSTSAPLFLKYPVNIGKCKRTAQPTKYIHQVLKLTVSSLDTRSIFYYSETHNTVEYLENQKTLEYEDEIEVIIKVYFMLIPRKKF